MAESIIAHFPIPRISPSRALRPMDDENMRSDDSNLHKSIGTGAFGRKPTGDFFETRNETVLKHGAKLPSRKADQTHIKIQM